MVSQVDEDVVLFFLEVHDNSHEQMIIGKSHGWKCRFGARMVKTIVPPLASHHVISRKYKFEYIVENSRETFYAKEFCVRFILSFTHLHK